MNRQYEISDTLSAVWGQSPVKFGGDGILAHTGGNSKEFGGPIYDGEFIYNTCTAAVAVCESQAFLDNHRQREELHAELRQRELHGQRQVVVAVRAGRLEGSPEPDRQPRPAL